MRLNVEDMEFLNIVAGKLEFMSKLVRQERTSSEVARNLSVILRFLLVEGDPNLQRAWRLSGFEKHMSVIPVVPPVDTEGTTTVAVYIEGGAVREGLQVGGIRIHNRALSDEEIRSRYEAQRDLMEVARSPIPLITYLDRSPCISVGGSNYTCRQLISYVANKLGGVHFDVKKRDPDTEAIRGMRILNPDPLLLQTYSIAEMLLSSPDVNKLLARIRDVLAQGHA